MFSILILLLWVLQAMPSLAVSFVSKQYLFLSVPSQVNDVKEALTQFQLTFFDRYGSGPQFIADTIDFAVRKAFETEARKRKPLGDFITFKNLKLI